MSAINKLIGFGLRQVLDPVALEVGNAIRQYFIDHSQTLPKALARSNDRAWQALGIALAGDGFLDQLKVFFSSSDDKGIREQVRLFLEGNAISFEGTPANFRKHCLAELKAARQAGLLSATKTSPEEVSKEASSFQRYADLKGLEDEAVQVVSQIALELGGKYPNLGKLVRYRPGGGPPLLVAAFAFFFRREVETDDELAHSLFCDGLRQLSASQAKSFTEVNKALASLGERFDQVFERLDRIESVVSVTQSVAVATHGAVLDMQAELQRLGSLHLTNGGEVRGLLLEVLNRVSQTGMQKGEVKPQHSFSIRSEDEHNAVKQLLARFRQMPADQQKQLPALLNGLGKLQIGSGDFAGARETFLAVSHNANEAAAQAEAQFNAYRAALEEKKWKEALAAIEQAAALDSQRFAPFPLQRYQTKSILGAGGFGTVFLCHDRFFNAEVVVKALHDAALERNMNDVFREAQVLGQLHHPGIIGVRDCNYADFSNLARPYIVMDYFPGGSLESFLHERGTMSPDDLIEVAGQVAQGMQAAHQHGILHRDLKPANILVCKEGSNWKVKIIDFGLALRKQTIETSMAVRSAGNTILSDSVAGTVKYAPPEQMGEMRGVKPGPYSDVYSFGKLCCYALFKTTEPRKRHWSSIPDELAEILERCIEQELKHRLPNFEPVLKTLDSLDPVKLQLKPGHIFTNSLGMKFAWIPPGTFIMGSPSGEEGREHNEGDDETHHKVTFTKGFYLGIYPVTQEQWQGLMGNNPSSFKGEENLPVEQVSWEDCQEFLKRLCEKESQEYRLPTEAEWEYACRAGTTTPFYFGETISTDQANYNGTYAYGKGKEGLNRGKTTKVGTFPPNSWGLYDMHGNVAEWCADWYGMYPRSSNVFDPQGPKVGGGRVVRGGSFAVDSWDIRSASRNGDEPSLRTNDVGFRLVRN